VHEERRIAIVGVEATSSGAGFTLTGTTMPRFQHEDIVSRNPGQL
jgi:hypothetical protein